MESFLDQPKPNTSFDDIGTLTDERDMGYDERCGEDLGDPVEVHDEEALARDGYPIDPNRDRRHARWVVDNSDARSDIPDWVFLEYPELVVEKFPR